MAAPPSLDQLVRSLTTYAGRDKAVRSLAFLSVLQSTRSGPEWAGLAKQMSAARLVFRQLNHPSMISACIGLCKKAPEDEVERGCVYLVTGTYTVYGVVELLAWLADNRILGLESTRLWRWCLYLWLVALIGGILRQWRILRRKGFSCMEKVKEDLLLLLSYSCDFISGVNSLPAGLLWAGKLSTKQTATFSLIASLIGFYRTF